MGVLSIGTSFLYPIYRKGDKPMKVKYNMVVDFARPNKSNTILVSENDANSRVCHFTLLYDRTPFDMSDVTSALIKGVAGETQKIFDDCEILRDDLGEKTNEIEYTLPAEVTQYTGTVVMTITLGSETGETITSFEFYVKIRNTLYNEDDYVEEDDMKSFRDLLIKTQAAIERLDEMTSQSALPNVTPIRITVDGVEYEYWGNYPGQQGSTTVIEMGHVAYIDEFVGEVEDPIDESAAGAAIRAAQSAEASANAAEALKGETEGLKADTLAIYNQTVEQKNLAAQSAEASATSAAASQQSANYSKVYFDRIEEIVPEVIVDEQANGVNINIKNVAGDHEAFIPNGVSSYVHVRYSEFEDGTNFSEEPSSTRKYIGVYTGQSQTAPTSKLSYKWSKFIGDGSGGGGASDWSAIDNRPFKTIDTEESFKLDENKKLEINREYVTQAEFKRLQETGGLVIGRDYRITDKPYRNENIFNNLNEILEKGTQGELTTEDVAGAKALEQLSKNTDEEIANVRNTLNTHLFDTEIPLTLGNTYTASSDGYIKISISSVTNTENQMVFINLNNIDIVKQRAITDNSTITSLYVKKGMTYKVYKDSRATVTITATFIPLK